MCLCMCVCMYVYMYVCVSSIVNCDWCVLVLINDRVVLIVNYSIFL